MNENVTVDEAISKGQGILKYPLLIWIFGIFWLGIYYSYETILPFWILPIGFLIGLGLFWLWWSSKITKWRLWAFDNVRNVHELKKRAIREKLIWTDNGILERTLIWSSVDKEKWNLLQYKFKQDDLFQDDLTIPNETIIYYSKVKNSFQMAIMLIALGGGIYLLLKADSYIIGSIFTICGAYFGYKEYKEATNTEPQIIINDKGIKTISTDFFSWSDIENEEVISKGSGKHINYYLNYNYPGGAEHLKIDDYNTDLKSLDKLLILYRGRSKNKTMNR